MYNAYSEDHITGRRFYLAEDGEFHTYETGPRRRVYTTSNRALAAARRVHSRLFPGPEGDACPLGTEAVSAEPNDCRQCALDVEWFARSPEAVCNHNWGPERAAYEAPTIATANLDAYDCTHIASLPGKAMMTATPSWLGLWNWAVDRLPRKATATPCGD